MTTVANALREGAARLPGDEARLEAELLLAHALDQPRSWFYAHSGDVLDEAALRAFDALLRRRAEGEPVAQITGVRGFWSLELAVTRDTLIPRPETERLVELALERLPRDEPAQVLDLGTGTGAIALAIASERPLADVTAVDASQAALDVARANAADAGLPLRALHGDWFAPVAGEVYRMIVSNPPYIADGDPHLSQGDLRFEPRSALASGPDGLDALRVITAGAPAHLLPGGWLLLEHGLEQGAAVRALLRAAGFTRVETARDLERRERISLGQWPG
ncbi:MULTISPECIES: peptide chain release factor N(5)-glutamine methyltransferase [unclassified Arenimonas]|uniref:peptide chain release factor N(5)-glutamine methyltransferase n=1 Tax=unclassified Arenimonas TaxID=2641713 RepID=UPI00086891FB|nr:MULTISPECIES: peptide chain release factor N(5)-glutamine methyltransferase [unclassified Arenimonas]ODS61733.1 MAG: protein-(glutamine-N5) methyltransferase, release factor-specific [Arenimonas sp. SCN 70-307]